MQLSPLIEFFEPLPLFISAGHDGLYPFEFHPFDEIYVIAKIYDDEEHNVEIWLPNGIYHDLYNIKGLKPSFHVHSSGYLWHDRTRDIKYTLNSRWLSIYGLTEKDPRNLQNDLKPIFTTLPSPSIDQSINDLLQSKEWLNSKDFHSRFRPWMANRKSTHFQIETSKRYERDVNLVSKIKSTRGAACQICGYRLIKKDGTDYCEVHHLESLSSGGLDIESNMIVVCANCHKMFHYSNVEIISHNHLNLTVKIDGNIYSCCLN